MTDYDPTLFHETDAEFTWWYASEADEWRGKADDAIDEGDAYINAGLASQHYRGMSLADAREARDELTRLIEYCEAEGYSTIDPRDLRIGMEVDADELPKTEMSPKNKHEKLEWVDDTTVSAVYNVDDITLCVDYEPVDGESVFTCSAESNVVVTSIKQIDENGEIASIDMEEVFGDE